MKIATVFVSAENETPDENTIHAIRILLGYEKIIQKEDGSIYGEQIKDKNEPALQPYMDAIQKQIDRLTEENENMKQELDFIRHTLPEEYLSEKQLQDIRKEYYEKYEQPMITFGMPQSETTTIASSMLDSYIERAHMERYSEIDTEKDYGWLMPDGVFYPVQYSEHTAWAQKYLDEHYPEEKYPQLYQNARNADGSANDTARPSAKDILIQKLGAVLLHSTYNGIAETEQPMEKNITKKQKEFLYDYYTKRKQWQKAKEFME